MSATLGSTLTGSRAMLLAIIVMLISTSVYSLSYVLQHWGTQAAIGENAGEDAGIKKLLKNPLWLTGSILFYVAGAVHLVALSLGSLAVVQPLIVTELVFIPPISALITKVMIPGRDWLWIFLVSGALAGFLIVAQPTEGNETAPGFKWAVVLIGFTVAIGLFFLIGSRLGESGRAAMYGTATGLVNALYVIAAKGAFGNPGALLWVLIPVAVLSAIGGVVFATIAFRSGPITISSPAMIAINPIAATLVAMWLFEVEINHSLLDALLIVVSIAIVLVGIFKLSRSSAVHGDEDVAHEVLVPPAPIPD
ncbi:MAG: DMT family transporter [Candidatus Nanopelagicales bacterium]